MPPNTNRKFKYFDIHCHLNFDDYKNDIDAVIGRMREEKVGAIVVGTTLGTSRRAVEIANQYPDCLWATVGCHPIHANEGFNTPEYEILAKDPKVVGIGECGLDYFHTEDGSLDNQKKVFEAQIQLALNANKPLMLHIRNSKENSNSAYADVLRAIGNRGVRANAHFFAGTRTDAKSFVERGFSLSFTGVITFAKEYESLIQAVPLDRIMSETDAPYVSPVPHRGKRNEPQWVAHTAHKIVDIQGQSNNKYLVENAMRFWEILEYK